MPLKPQFETFTLHQCDNCLNYYLLLPNQTNPLCPRDNKPLRVATTPAALDLLKYFKVYCHGCGVLRRLARDGLTPCSLCNCHSWSSIQEESPPCATEDHSASV